MQLGLTLIGLGRAPLLREGPIRVNVPQRRPDGYGQLAGVREDGGQVTVVAVTASTATICQSLRSGESRLSGSPDYVLFPIRAAIFPVSRRVTSASSSSPSTSPTGMCSNSASIIPLR